MNQVPAWAFQGTPMPAVQAQRLPTATLEEIPQDLGKTQDPTG